MAGVYWLGADGNYYVKADGVTGVQAFAPGAGGGLPSFAPLPPSIINSLTPIADPNAPQSSGGGGGTSAPSNPTGGGTSAPTFADKSADISMQNAGLSASDSKTTAGVAKIEDELQQILGNYNTEADNAETKYSSSSDQNQNNLQKNKESALLNAAQGRRGLFGTLAGLGALGGSGIDLANRAVQNGANEDLSGASDTYAGNQSGLDTSIGDFRTANDERKKSTQSAADAAKSSAQNEGAKEKQGFLTNLANDYAAEGDTANAKKYTDMASALYPEIATSAVPSAGPSYISAAFTAPNLSNYLVNGNTTVKTTPAQNGGLPGLIATNPFDPTKKKLATA